MRKILFGVVSVILSTVTHSQLTPTELENAFNNAKTTVQGYQSADDSAYKAGMYLKNNDAYERHQLSTHGEAPNDYKYPANLFCAATLDLVDKKVVKQSDTYGLRSQDVSKSSEALKALKSCQSTVAQHDVCQKVNRYTFDGSCNNLGDPLLGRVNSCHRRLKPPTYSDGVDMPRSTSVLGGPLPNERIISLTALNSILPNVFDDKQFNHNRMSFGQFIAHDITLTPTTTIGDNNALPDCCNPSNRMQQCFPITIPDNDKFYGNRRCMNFVRSQPCPLCALGPREQMNAVTSFVDLSHIYGLSNSENRNLRALSNGRLRGEQPYGSRYPQDYPLLMPPTAANANDGCTTPQERCFLGGDPLRVNQQIGISAWSTLWFRYHNYLADRINIVMTSRGQKWSDERLFQTARRIAQAHFQIQVYKEWLPTIVGSNLMALQKLSITQTQTTYEPSASPNLWSEFAGGSFRFGHSIIQNVFQNVNYQTDERRPTYDVPTRDAFSSIPRYRESQTPFIPENFVAGMYNQPGKEISFSFAQGVTNDVYRNSTERVGMDLPALNIHRGRDHALQPYYIYAQQFISQFNGRNTIITNWNQVQPYWRRDCFETLPKIYKDVRDVDLYVGGLCEVPIQSGSVGATFGSIIAMQFNQLRYGDRLFVSHDSAFSKAQYAELLRTGNIYNVICSSAVDQQSVYTDAFRYGSWSVRDAIECDELDPIDVSLFTDIAKDL